MLLTNLLLACGLSCAVATGLSVKESQNLSYNEKSQQQLYLDNKKNAIEGDLQTNVWYRFNYYVNDFSGLSTETAKGFYCYGIDETMVYEFNTLKRSGRPAVEFAYIINNATLNTTSSIYDGSSSSYPQHVYTYIKFTELPLDNSNLTFLQNNVTLSENQDIGSGGSVVETTFEVVTDATTGFVGTLSSALNACVELVYDTTNNEFTIAGVLMLISVGVGLVWALFALVRHFVRKVA